MPTMDLLLHFCSKAFKVGFGETTKRQLSRQKLFEQIQMHSLRNFHKGAIWEAYKSGRFASQMGDSI